MTRKIRLFILITENKTCVWAIFFYSKKNDCLFIAGFSCNDSNFVEGNYKGIDQFHVHLEVQVSSSLNLDFLFFELELFFWGFKFVKFSSSSWTGLLHQKLKLVQMNLFELSQYPGNYYRSEIEFSLLFHYMTFCMKFEKILTNCFTLIFYLSFFFIFNFLSEFYFFSFFLWFDM